MNERYQMVVVNVQKQDRYVASAERRLARFLKTIKRAYGFECKSICPLSDDPKDPKNQIASSADITKILAEME